MKTGQLLVLCALVGPAVADTPFDAPRPKPGAPPPATKSSPYKGLGADSIPPQEVAKFAPPPLDAEVARRIEAIMDVRDAGSGVITAKGDRMYFESRVTGVTQVWRQDGPMKLPIQLTGGVDRTTIAALSPDEKWLAITRDRGGEENPGLYLQSVDGGPLRLVQHAPKVQTLFEFWSDDSKSVVYRANDVEQDSYALYRFEPATGKRERVFDQPGLWSIEDHRVDTWLLRKRTGSRFDEIYQYEVATKKLTPLLGQNEEEQFNVVFGAKPGQVIVRTNKPSDFHRLYSLEGGKLAPISPEIKFDVESVKIDRARTRIYYQVNENGYSKPAILDAKTLKPIALPKLPASENVWASNVSRQGRFVQFVLDGSAQIGETVSWDWQTKKLVTWRLASAPELDPKSFVKATLDYFPARDGVKVPMFVRRPSRCEPAELAKRGEDPCPVVVDFHGGPEAQARPKLDAQAQLLAEAGFVVVTPNVRGSDGYGKTWLRADDGPKRLAVVTDIEDIAKHIRATSTANGKAPKLGVIGGSYGGYSVLMAMTYFAGAYDAGVQRVGISNLLTFLENTAAYRRALRTTEYGDPVKDRDALVKLSPITHVKKIKGPLLSIQGVNDPRVPVGEAVQIYRELEHRKIPGGLILFPDEGHSIAKRSNRVLSLGHTIAFLEKHLK